jgi:hypothetical protein
MNIFALISELEQADPEFMDRINPRRRVFQYLGSCGKKVTAAGMPAIVASFFSRAYGQTSSALPATVTSVLNLALQLEYLEYYFYDTALNTTGLINAADTPAIQLIRNDEAGHINTLRNIAGFTPIADPGRNAFDYSGGSGSGNGPLRDALTPGNDVLFFGAAQAFSDTGVRAYKGGAPALNTTATKDILEAALNIHSVEARHNSHFRTVRRGLAANLHGSGAATAAATSPFDAAPKSWISLIDNGGPVLPDGSHPAAAVYNAGNPATDYPAESNVTQAGVNLTTTPGGYSAALASEAFDEPLDPTTVKTIARMFVTPASGLFQ